MLVSSMDERRYGTGCNNPSTLFHAVRQTIIFEKTNINSETMSPTLTKLWQAETLKPAACSGVYKDNCYKTMLGVNQI